jgi:succinoglycan biosynthesis protein ExoV
MNLWFWDDVMPGWREMLPDTTLFGIGTLIGQATLSGYPKILVCGSGAGYGGVGNVHLDHVTFSWVRGPRTAKLLGLDARTAITDGACLVAELPRFENTAEHRTDTIFVPHRLTAKLALNWGAIEQRADLKVVLPQDDAVSVIKRIRDARLVIAESMHGAIIADAFRVPWIPVAISHHFNTFKWQVWADSMEVELRLNEALRLPRNAYFILRNQRQKLRNLRRTQTGPNQKPVQSTAPFENPNYLDKTERDSVKTLIARLAPVVEHLLARDLRRLARQRPSLSSDSVLAGRKDRMRECINAVYQT